MAIEGFKVILKSPQVLRQVDYNGGGLIIVTIDISSIAIRSTIRQNDKESNWFVIRFGTRILTKMQRAYLQMKRKLWDALTILKVERNYLISAHVVLEWF